MGRTWKSITLSIFFALCAQQPLPASSPELIKAHFLLTQNNIKDAIPLYKAHKEKSGFHDCEFLEQLAMHFLKQGIGSPNPESQMLALYGASFASVSSALPLCTLAMRSEHPMVQIAGIRLLGQMQDDRCEELLVRASSSPLLQLRLEASYQLALRKAKQATGLCQSLMHHLPNELHVFFPKLFALIGTPEAMSILKTCFNHPSKNVTLSAIAAAAESRRDDFLPQLRAILTHNDAEKQEAAAFALGLLQDLHSHSALRTLSRARHRSVRAAAYKSLALLGDQSIYKAICDFAEPSDLCSIPLLAYAPEGREKLASMLFHPNKEVRFNAAITLLEHKDPRLVPTLIELLTQDERDLGIYPMHSRGGSMTFFKVHPSKQSFDKIAKTNLCEISLALREHFLSQAIDLSESSFLRIARSIFQQKQNDLVPTTIHLLESIGSKQVEEFLKEYTTPETSPLIRDYCRLALYRMNQVGEGKIHSLLQQIKKNPLIRFRPMLSWTEIDNRAGSVLTPSEQSRLLTETLMTIADKHSEQSIDMLLDVMHSGHNANTPAIAGFLLRTIQ